MWPPRSTSVISPGIRASRAFRGYAGCEASIPLKLPVVVISGTPLAHYHNPPPIQTHPTHSTCRWTLRCPQTGPGFSQVGRLLRTRPRNRRAPPAETCRCHASPWRPTHTKTSSPGPASGGRDICGRPLTIWCTPSCATPCFCSRVRASQTLSSSRASGGTSTGRRARCRGFSHHHTASLNFGVHGRSFMQTTGAYDSGR